MAQSIYDLDADPTYQPSGDDALEYAAIAEEALARGATDRCRVALDRGVAAVVAVGRTRTDDHLHFTMRTLTDAVDRGTSALETDPETADARATEAITAIRRTVAQLDAAPERTASASARGHWYL